jgi:uncharacterized protein YraI
MALAAICAARQTFEEPSAKVDAEKNEVALPDFPFYAEIITNDVYIRSGPGTQHYFCGKLNKGNTVKVLSRKFSWLLIVPPKGSFSWISKQYVTIDPGNPDIGIVTGDEVRVYAGSDYVAPIHSDRVQLKLNKNNKVVLLGEEIGDYYKIAPPKGAYLWVSSDYIRPLAEPVKVQKVEAVAPAVEPKAEALPAPVKTAVVPTRIPAESDQLRKFYALQEFIKTERTKPLHEQDFSKIKPALEQLVKDKSSHKASRYAEFTLEQIKCYELAAAVEQVDDVQDTQLADLCKNIDNAHTEKMTEFQDIGRFAAIGTLKKSNVYGPEAELLHYVITNNAGKVICYALPSGPSERTDLANLMGQKVGLVGAIAPHPQTAGALVKFTEIEMIR